MKQYDELHATITKSHKRVENLFQSLLVKAFTGELTAAWREAHRPELEAAARERDELLGLTRFISIEDKGTGTETIKFMVTRPTRAVQTDLDPATQALLAATRAKPAYFRVEELLDSEEPTSNGLSAVQAEAALCLLAALGLVRQVQVAGQSLWRAVDAVRDSAGKPGVLA